MNSAGYLSTERLSLIPEKYWKAHEFCFFIHDNLLQAIDEYEHNGIHNDIPLAFNKIIKENGLDEQVKGMNIIEFMKKCDLTEEYEQYITGHIVSRLVLDMIDYLYESLTCFENRKFSVGFSLLRKPLKEHLFYLSWLLADRKDFISRFESKPYETLNHIPKEQKIKILNEAIKFMPLKDAFEAETIWDIINSKNNPNSFEPLLQRATHLITSMGDILKTEDYSMNFIFEDSSQNYHYDFLYSKMPYLFIFISQVIFSLLNETYMLNKVRYSNFVITTMGCYEAIFLDWRKQPIKTMLNPILKDFLTCVVCDKHMKITKKNAPLLYLSEVIICNSCGTSNNFPLHWILCKSKAVFIK